MAAIGFSSGMWCVMDINTRDNIAEQKESTHPVTCIQWAPNGILLVIATKVTLPMASILEYRTFPPWYIASTMVSACTVPAESAPYLRGWSVQIGKWNQTSFESIPPPGISITVGSWVDRVACSYLDNCVGEQIEPSAVRDLKWASISCRLSFEAGCATHATSGTFGNPSLSTNTFNLDRIDF